MALAFARMWERGLNGLLKHGDNLGWMTQLEWFLATVSTVFEVYFLVCFSTRKASSSWVPGVAVIGVYL